jgi:hypothetical protein
MKDMSGCTSSSSFGRAVFGKKMARQFGQEFALLMSSLLSHVTKHARWNTWLQCVRMIGDASVAHAS